MTDNIQLVTPNDLKVSLNGVVQRRVVAFNTRAGWVKVLQKNGEGEWFTEELSGIVSARCDLTQQTSQALGSGEGTN